MSRTVQQTANSSGSTSIVEVGTNSGFNAGDLVYFSGNDYKGPTGFTAPASATFNITKTVPSGAFSGYVKSVFTAAEVQTLTTGTAGSSKIQFAAVLTNGNIVQAYTLRSNGYPYFRIVDTSGNIVVAATGIGTSGANATVMGAIGCCALTGGGFAVYGTTGAGYVWTAIYSNTGAVVQSINVDSTNSGFVYTGIQGVALSTGGFAIVIVSIASPYNIYYRAYGSTGTAAYSWQTAGTAPTGIYNPVGIAARNNGTFAYTYPTTSGYSMGFVSVAAAGTNSTQTINCGNSSGVLYASGLACLSDGQTLVLSYLCLTASYSSSYLPTFRLIPSSNTPGSEIYVPYGNLNYGPSSPYISNVTAVGTGFVLSFTDETHTLQYVFYDATGACVSGTNSNGAVPRIIYGSSMLPNAQGCYAQFIESGSNVLVYWQASNCVSNALIYNQQSAKINKTTYDLVPYGNTTSATVATVSAAVSGVGYANTTPTKIAYAAASSGAVAGTSPTAYVVGVTPVSSSACETINSCALSNGNNVVVTRGLNSGAINFYIINSTGATVGSGLVDSTSYGAGSYSYALNLFVTGLQSGAFVVMYYTSGTQFSLYVYSSTGSLLATSTGNSAGSINYSTGGGVVGLADGDRFAIMCSNSSGYPSYRVFSYASGAITAVTSLTTIQSVGAACYAIAADDCGGFATAHYYSGGGSNYFFAFYPNGASSYTASNNTTFGSNAYYYGRTMTYFGGIYYVQSPSSSTSSQSYVYAFSAAVGTFGSGVWAASGNSQNTADRSTIGLGRTSSGSLATVQYGSSTASQPTFTGLHGAVNWGNSNYSYSAPSTNHYYDSSATFYNGPPGPSATACPASGNNAFCAWVNASQIPVFAIVTVDPASVSTTLVAGVTASNGVSIYGNSTTTSGVISNTTFAGVAASTAAAGGTGQLIVNGTAQLNSNYSTSTPAQSFDYTGLPAPGVKGSSVGKIVNMQGNT